MNDMKNKTKEYIKSHYSKEYWKKKLTAEQYDVCFLGGTEPPFTGKYWNHHEKGTYHCVACGEPLFSSENKYDSGTGWPSFDRPMGKSNLEFIDDYSFNTHRIEVRCKNCGAHLGHVFDDGPKATTGKRYCVNSQALAFKPIKNN